MHVGNSCKRSGRQLRYKLWPKRARHQDASSHQSKRGVVNFSAGSGRFARPVGLCDWQACPAGVREYQKVNDWAAANPFFRPSFVSGALHAGLGSACLSQGHESAVIDSPPDVRGQGPSDSFAQLQVMGMLAKSNPVAAWHAAEAVRMAAEAGQHIRPRGTAFRTVCLGVIFIATDLIWHKSDGA